MTLFLEWNAWTDSERMVKFFNHEARIAELEAVIREEHGGRNHEPECPLCMVLVTPSDGRAES